MVLSLAIYPFRSYSLPALSGRRVGHAMQFFRDKTILITGGSSGIGRAAALRLAGYGANVVVAARNKKALDDVVLEANGQEGKIVAVPTDVMEAEQCRQAVEETVAHFGRLDILVCSAGLSLRA